ncbi:MAG: hypothetical protein QXX41_05885, partial [Nitrososphaerota archaeon]
QVEKNIRKNLEYADTLYIIASDEAAKKKVIQVALKTMFRLKKEKPDKVLNLRIASINELETSKFKEWFEIKSGEQNAALKL